MSNLDFQTQLIIFRQSISVSIGSILDGAYASSCFDSKSIMILLNAYCKTGTCPEHALPFPFTLFCYILYMFSVETDCRS